jgi:hypothetical protein
MALIARPTPYEDTGYGLIYLSVDARGCAGDRKTNHWYPLITGTSVHFDISHGSRWPTLGLAALVVLTACHERHTTRRVTLTSAGVTVTLMLSDALSVDQKNAEDTSLRFAVRYPSGERRSSELRPDAYTVYVLLRPVGVSMKTRTESDVDEASVAAPSGPSGRAWFDSKSAEGVSLYKYRLSNDTEWDLRVFTATDGSLVGTKMAAPPFVMHETDRRYRTELEVIYLFPGSLAAAPEVIDKFVVEYLDANVAVQRK